MSATPPKADKPEPTRMTRSGHLVEGFKFHVDMYLICLRRSGWDNFQMVTVRVAVIEDADAIASLTAEVQQLHNKALPDIFKTPSHKLFSGEKLVTVLHDANSTVAVAESNGEVIGLVYGVIMQRAENDYKVADKYMYIQQIGVRRNCRRQGVGRALIAFIEGRAVASAVTGLQLDYWAFNTRAQSFFEACGFSPSQVMMRRTLSSQ